MNPKILFNNELISERAHKANTIRVQFTNGLGHAPLSVLDNINNRTVISMHSSSPSGFIILASARFDRNGFTLYCPGSNSLVELQVWCIFR